MQRSLTELAKEISALPLEEQQKLQQLVDEQTEELVHQAIKLFVKELKKRTPVEVDEAIDSMRL